jgi:hypothetical protein
VIAGKLGDRREEGVGGEEEPPIVPDRGPDGVGGGGIDARGVVGQREGEGRAGPVGARVAGDLDGGGVSAAHVLQHRLEDRARRQGDPFAVEGLAGHLGGLGRQGEREQEGGQGDAHGNSGVCVRPADSTAQGRRAFA